MRSLSLLVLLGCGGPVEQSASCATYVSCVEARDLELGQSTDLERFLPDGACWGGAEGGELCERACTNGLDWLQANEDDLPEVCQP